MTMAYDNEMKINLEFFENIPIIEVGNSLKLTLPYFKILETEAELYLKNSSNKNIKRFLPLVYVGNLKESIRELLNFQKSMLYKVSILYCIRLNNKMPIGYINLNTPMASTGLNSWSVDYWINKSFMGKGIVSACLSHLLLELQKYNVPEVYALVNSDNLKSIAILERVGFQFINKENLITNRLLYKINIK